MKRTAELKRTPFKRKAPLRAAANEAKATIQPKECKACAKEFFPARTMQVVCGQRCATKLVALNKKAEKAADRAKKEAMKPLREIQAEAQREFNRWTRLRDRLAGHPCISCGKPLNWNSDKSGGEVDAGHYMSRGGSPELAFVEANVNAQHKSCNRPGGAKRAEFRLWMIDRHGLAVVEELEGPTKPARLRHDDYRRIRDTYRAKANELQKKINETC